MSNILNNSVSRALVPVSQPRDHQTPQQQAARKVQQTYAKGELSATDSVTLSSRARQAQSPISAVSSKSIEAVEKTESPYTRNQVRTTYGNRTDHPLEATPNPGSLLSIRI